MRGDLLHWALRLIWHLRESLHVLGGHNSCGSIHRHERLHARHRILLLHLRRKINRSWFFTFTFTLHFCNWLWWADYLGRAHIRCCWGLTVAKHLLHHLPHLHHLRIISTTGRCNVQTLRRQCHLDNGLYSFGHHDLTLGSYCQLFFVLQCL